MIRHTCPSCLVKMKAPDGLAGKRVRCPKCKTAFAVPAAAEATPESILEDLPILETIVEPIDEESDHPDAPTISPRVLTAIILSSLGAFLLVILIVTSRAGGHNRRERPERKNYVEPADDPNAADCKIVREWLNQKYGKVEIVSWGRRTLSHLQGLGDYATISAVFRLEGSRTTMRGLFTIGPSDTVENATISD
jgi:hypothetical protein